MKNEMTGDPLEEIKSAKLILKTLGLRKGGYMTNEQDEVNMQDPEYEKKMVKGIANGIDQYFAAGN